MILQKKFKEEKITRTAIVIISDVIDPETYEYSKLYDKKFSHGYRKAKKIKMKINFFLIPIFNNFFEKFFGFPDVKIFNEFFLIVYFLFLKILFVQFVSRINKFYIRKFFF